MLYTFFAWIQFHSTSQNSKVVALIIAPSFLETVQNLPCLCKFFSNFSMSFFLENSDIFQIMLFLSFAMHFTYLQFLNPSLSGLLRGFFLRKAGNKMISLSETCQKYAVIKIRFKVAVLKFKFEFQAHLIRQEILRKKLWWSEKAFFSFKEFIFVRINF